MRLAGVSALLTFVILCGFAVAIGSLTVHKIRTDFNRQVAEAAKALPSEMTITFQPFRINPPLSDLALPSDHAVIKVLTPAGEVIDQQPSNAPSFGTPSAEAQTVNGYRVVSRPAYVVESNGQPVGRVVLQYGRKVADTEDTVSRVELFLLLGVLAGSVPRAARGHRDRAPRDGADREADQHGRGEIARTRDPSRGCPPAGRRRRGRRTGANTRGDAPRAGCRPRRDRGDARAPAPFVADASHELRTPLTSVLANLELLAESLQGEQGEAARSALRSSQRMRRLVADLLLLARTDAARVVKREPCDLGQIAVEAAAASSGPSARSTRSCWTSTVRPSTARAMSFTARDQPDRERAAPHARGHGDPRVDEHAERRDRRAWWWRTMAPVCRRSCRSTLFERFVRGAGDRGGSFGLGLAIVQAVAVSHGGSVELEPRPGSTGARFVVRAARLLRPRRRREGPWAGA